MVRLKDTLGILQHLIGTEPCHVVPGSVGSRGGPCPPLLWCPVEMTGAFCLSLQIEEENAALLAALTDSLDEVGGLGVFPSLGEGLEEEEEEEDLPQDNEPFPGSLSPETEDPSLVRTLPCCLRWMWMSL